MSRDVNRADESEGSSEDDAGRRDQRLGDVVAQLEQRRADEQQRSQSASSGILLDQLAEVEQRLLGFGRALGGRVSSVSDLPFTEEAGTDHMPEPLYVRHDTEMLNQVVSWLLQDQHIGLVSPFGTGKSAFREIVLRDLDGHQDFVIAALDNPREATPRALYEAVLRAAYAAGYEIDPSNYWQVRDGIPWATEEAKRAVQEVTAMVREEGRSILLIVDEIEVLGAELLSPLQVAGDAGVRLFLLGTPEGKERIAEMRATLDSRLRYYDGIEPFDADAIEEYIARSLAYFRGEPYEGQGQGLFTRAAIEDLYERTGGVQREVRIECRELFTRAAFVWYRTGQDVERIKITPELRHRRFGMSY